MKKVVETATGHKVIFTNEVNKELLDEALDSFGKAIYQHKVDKESEPPKPKGGEG